MLFAGTVKEGLKKLSRDTVLVLLGPTLPDLESTDVAGLIRERNPVAEVALIASRGGQPADSQPGRREAAPAAGGEFPDVPPHILNRILKVRDFILENYSTPLSLAAACGMAATSKTYFCHYFKRVTGRSLRGYQQVLKIRMAERLLRDRGLSVTDVAMKVGYNDSNYFSTVYKKITGSPPRYQRGIKEEPEKNKKWTKTKKY